MQYEIDEDDVITHVDREWSEFATDNGTTRLDSTSVVGTSIWQYFAGEEVQQLYHQVFRQVRRLRSPASIPLRCDSPGTRRFLRLSVESLPESGLRLTVVTEHLEDRSPVALLDSNVRRNSEFLPICGWCKKIRLSDQTWVEVEETVNSLRLFDSPLPQLSHGLCRDCSDQMRRDIGITSSLE